MTDGQHLPPVLVFGCRVAYFLKHILRDWLPLRSMYMPAVGLLTLMPCSE